MNSVMKHQFSQVPQAKIPRSSFNRSHGLKTTFDSGYLVPVYCDEALPGDTFNLKMNGFARMSTLIYPLMDNLFLDTFFFAVPIRLLWTNWQKFNGEQDDPGDSTTFLIPTVAAPASVGHINGSLYDYFGVPTKIADIVHSNLWGRAYNLIYNEWFRDQNLQDSVVVDKDDGPDTSTDYALLKRGKRHDYFTSCLPWPQKGTAVEIPLGTTATVKAHLNTVENNPMQVRAANNDNLMGATGMGSDSAGDYNTDASTTPAYLDPNSRLYADLTNATAATINQLREAFQIQKLYERDARGGTRYTEIIRAHFGVTSPDARLQRPEYLGGGSTYINVHPVSQDSQTATTPQATLAAFATGAINGHGFTKSFTEHCILIGLVNARADLTYQQGLNRMWSRSTRWDFFWPALANIGEQSVLNQEIYMDDSANDILVFGYQERFAEYRYKPSMITGQFRSNDATSLDGWHLSQDFASLPVLDTTFIKETLPMARILATPAEPDFIGDFYFNLKTARPMPLFGVPGNIDRF